LLAKYLCANPWEGLRTKETPETQTIETHKIQKINEDSNKVGWD